MKKQFNDPRGGLLIALGVLLAALWGIIAFGAYEESKRAKYDVSVRPGAVTYGTLSTATVPTMSVSTYRSSVPMISGGAVRSYAHYGHATMPKASGTSSYRLHTTSSATVHSIGGGGSTGGGGSYSGGGSSYASSRINYSGGSVSMPSLAMATPSRSSSSMSGLASSVASDASSLVQPTTTMETTTLASPMRRGGIRKAHPTDDGTEQGQQGTDTEDPTKTWWWNEDTEEWVDEPFNGAQMNIGGLMYRYNNGEWELIPGQADPTPLGDAPWHWMLLLAIGYGVVRTIKMRKQKQI